MGIKMAPMYATLTLAYLDENHTTKTKIQNLLDHRKDTQMTVSYYGNAHGAILSFTSLTSKPPPELKFTMEHSFKELPFLDILIKN